MIHCVYSVSHHSTASAGYIAHTVSASVRRLIACQSAVNRRRTCEGRARDNAVCSSFDCSYEEVVNAIIRPPRAEYDVSDLGTGCIRRVKNLVVQSVVTERYRVRLVVMLPLPAGPQSFVYCGRKFERTDLELSNARGMKLICSHWQPADT